MRIMRGPSPQPAKRSEIQWKLSCALMAAGCFAVVAYFRRSFSTGRHRLSGPDHNLGEALFAGSLAFIVALLMLFFGSKRKDSTKRKELEATFYGIAGRLQGKVLPPSWPQPPRMYFPAEGRSAILEYCSSDSYEGMTRVTVDLKDHSPGMLMIFQDSIRSLIPKLFGAQDISVGDPEFDRRYMLQASPESVVHRLFRPDHRAQVMESVLRIGALPDATIHLTRECLTVRARGYLRQDAELWALARTAKDFTRFILELAPPVEIAWVESSNQGGECRICGTPMGDRIVLCSRCQTPHHLDCWRYNGRCSIFACGETQFTNQR